MKKLFILLLILGCAIPVFAKKRPEEAIITPMAQLEKRQYQTRIYNKEDKIVIMKAILNVLQDEGYIVYNVNSLLGFIYGVKDYDTSDHNVDISKEFGFTKSRLTYNGVKIATMETTANITEYSDNTRVRINFKRKLLNEYGNAQFIDDIEDSEYYEGFYTKVDNAIKLQQTAGKNVQKEIPATQKIKQEIQESIPEIENQPVNPTEPEVIEEQTEQQPEEKIESKGDFSEPVLSEKELKKLEKSLAKEQAKLAKEQEKQAKQEAKMLKELEKINE